MMAIRAIRAFGDIGAAGAQQYVIVFTQYHTLCTISCNTHDIQLFYICVCVWASSLDWPWTSGAPGLPHNYHHAHDRLLDGEGHHQNHHQLVLFCFSAFYVKVRQYWSVILTQPNIMSFRSLRINATVSMHLGNTTISLTSHVQHSYVRAPCNKYFWQNFFSYCQNHYLESYSLKQIPLENNNYTGF